MASPPSPANAATHLDLMLALRRFRSSELHELLDSLRRSDARVEAAACALIDDMLPPRKGYPPFPVEPIKRFGPAELRELALSLCFVAPAAQAVALVEIERLQLVRYGWCGRGDGAGGASSGGLLWKMKKKRGQSESPTTTTTTTTPSEDYPPPTGDPASTPTTTVAIAVATAAGGGGSACDKKGKRRTTRKLKQAIVSFLDSMEYANDGNIYRG
ncbi:hypothetical protein SLS62_004442 [Diatrype stigma]|uniref:Uncharacterized protein n=1 Tax=Diatrype stigma TaxID=117547 RepID=A0AAN9V320_9PEZI